MSGSDVAFPIRKMGVAKGMGRIIMSQKELKRLRVTEKVVAGELTQINAAEILGISER